MTGRAITARRPQDRRTRIRRLTLTALTAVVLAVPAVAHAHHHPTICERAYPARQTVITRFDYPSAGRNVCRVGLKDHSRPSTHQRARYLRALNGLAHAPHWPFMHEYAGGPKVWPSGTRSLVVLQPVGIAACIISKESLTSGLDRANNGSHFGIGQWDIGTWLSQGGGRYGGSPLDADYQQQLRVLSFGISRDGCRPWCPYEPGPACG